VIRRRPAGGRDPLNVRDGRRGALDVGDGDTVVLLGASGEGKTAWLRSLLCLEEPFDTVLAFGGPLTRATAGEVLSWVPEGDGVFLSDTVWDNVEGARYGRGCVPALAADALDLVGLADRAREPVANLAAGERRRVALARAVARRRPLLVVDGELDPTVWGLWPALRAGMPWLRGVLLATATAGDIAHQADSVALVERGCVIAQAPMALLADSLDPAVRAVMAWVTP
jgi:zinc transport system ATP-binding protein